MAKGKATHSVKQQSAASKNRKAPAAVESNTSAPVKKLSTSPTPSAISAEEIGRVAGDVWGLLATDGAQTLAAIKKSVDAPADVVVAALGWLAREDKLKFTTSGRQVNVSLR